MTRLDAVRLAAHHEIARRLDAEGYSPELELAYGLLVMRQSAGELVAKLGYLLPAAAVTRIAADGIMAEAVGPHWFPQPAQQAQGGRP
jgi:hypothetical protein